MDLRPDIGSQPRWTPKSIIRRRASQKVGIANPIKTNTVVTLSMNVSWWVAERTPKGIAAIKIRARERTFIVIVMGSLSIILSVTLRPSGENEFPKSREANFFNHVRY